MTASIGSRLYLLPRLRRAFLSSLIIFASQVVQADGTLPPIAVVVGHGQAPADPVSPTLVLGLFAKKRTIWSDGSSVVPVNLAASHPIRRAFSQAVFRKTPEQMQDYWNEQYFHGVLPPPVLGSEEAVLRFVSATRGAVGYVSTCTVDRRVDVIAIVPGTAGATECPR